jgi:hypothetical protein
VYVGLVNLRTVTTFRVPSCLYLFEVFPLCMFVIVLVVTVLTTTDLMTYCDCSDCDYSDDVYYSVCDYSDDDLFVLVRVLCIFVILQLFALLFCAYSDCQGTVYTGLRGYNSKPSRGSSGHVGDTSRKAHTRSRVVYC